MKNKKNMFVLAIAALILVLGVGYAVVTQVTLTINGTAAGKEQALKVVYDGVNSGTTNGETGKVTQITSADNSIAATFTVTDMVKNDPVELEFEIQNKETDVDATLATPTISNNNAEYFSVSVQYKGAARSASGSFAAWGEGTKTLNHGDKATIKVIVTMIKTPVLEANNTATIGVSIVASPVNNANVTP